MTVLAETRKNCRIMTLVVMEALFFCCLSLCCCRGRGLDACRSAGLEEFC